VYGSPPGTGQRKKKKLHLETLESPQRLLEIIQPPRLMLILKRIVEEFNSMQAVA
jgi:hypothetical protein